LFTEVTYYTKTILSNFPDPVTYWQWMQYWDHNTPKQVDVVAGCFFWIRKEVIDKIGLLDDNFFMYLEDVEYCERVNKSDLYKVMYYPFAKIIHLKGASTITEAKIEAIKTGLSSAIYYLNKAYGKNTKNIFVIICKIAWRLESFLFVLLKFIDSKFEKKAKLLNILLRIIS
jgi:GT2 family glycosyltransferase